MAPEGSYVRWQAIAITQLGYAVGLVLSFTTASLGFALLLVKEPSYTPACWAKAFMLASLFSLILSAGIGLWCVVNRLRDFRKTRIIARDRETWEKDHKSKEEIDRSLEGRRAETERLGELTWTLFSWQVGTFILGAGTLMTAFATAYHSKLF